MKKHTFYISQNAFVREHEAVWREFDAIVDNHDPKLVELYRKICTHYALACQREYSLVLTQSLHQRVLLGHRQLYASQRSSKVGVFGFLLVGFPRRVRRHAKLFWLCFGLFYVPLVIMGVACYHSKTLIYSLIDPMQIQTMEQMYDPQNINIGRTSGTDVMMFGYYAQNNIGIDFKVYATGIFLGIGTVLVTLYNGVVIGALAGHLTGVGLGSTFWQFVLGHGAFELTAVVIAAMAGLQLGMALIAPAPYGRIDALKVYGKSSAELIFGAALMTLLAAFIEAFWSSSTQIPSMVKYVVAALLWALVAWYLLRCGREV